MFSQVEVGNPNVVWSASEDGTLRQHDFREACCCPPNEVSEPECRSVLVVLHHLPPDFHLVFTVVFILTYCVSMAA